MADGEEDELLLSLDDGAAEPAGTRIGRVSSPGEAEAETVAAGRATSGWLRAEANSPPPTAVTPSAAAANQVSGESAMVVLLLRCRWHHSTAAT